MITSTIERKPKHTVELTITVPWSEIKSTYDKVFDTVSEEVEISGFRKGKAPKELVEKHINRTKLYEEVVKQIVPKAYAEAVTKHELKPIVSPRVEVLEAKEESDWKIKATVAEKPVVNLKNYKTAVAKVRGGKSSLWVPGQKEEKGAKDKEEQAKLEDVLKALLEEAEVEIPDMLLEDEVNRMLSRLIDQTQKLGMTIEQYLLAQGKTGDQLRVEYSNQALDTLRLEFILDKVAEAEQITVTPQDIEKALEAVKDPKERENMRQNSYYIASLLRQQKTLDSLMSPVVK